MSGARAKGSTAVMAQRRPAREERRKPTMADLLGDEGPGKGVPAGVDDFPTPPWAVRALPEMLLGVDALRDCSVREPAANRGYLFNALKPYCGEIVGSDVHDYGFGFPVFDFLSLRADQMFPSVELPIVDWTITNPPFVYAAEFFELAMARSRRGVALLLRTQILESEGRFTNFFSKLEPLQWTFAVFVERVPFTEHRVVQTSSATSFGWLVVWKEKQDPQFLLDRRHIPPCRARLEKPGDYR